MRIDYFETNIEWKKYHDGNYFQCKRSLWKQVFFNQRQFNTILTFRFFKIRTKKRKLYSFFHFSFQRQSDGFSDSQHLNVKCFRVIEKIIGQCQ